MQVVKNGVSITLHETVVSLVRLDGSTMSALTARSVALKRMSTFSRYLDMMLVCFLLFVAVFLAD